MSSTQIKEYFHTLTSLRGLAALWVTIGHITWTLPSTSLVLFFPIIQEGYLAVDFFFILSGFVLAHAYHVNTIDNTQEYLRFCRARFSRILPIHLFILILFTISYFIFLKIGITLPGTYDIKGLIAEIFLVHIIPIFDKTYFFAWNYPAWTLGLEVWWFIIIVGGITIFNKFTKKYSRTFSIFQNRNTYLITSFFMLFVLICIMLFNKSPAFIDTPNFHNSLIRSGLEFLAGLFLYKAFLIKEFKQTKNILRIIYLLIFIGITSWYFPVPTYLIIAYWLILIPLVIIASLNKGSSLHTFLIRPTLLYLGNISYALYLVHGPIERIIAVLHLKFSSSILNTIFFYFIFISLSLVLASLCHKYIEKPFMKYFKKKNALETTT